MGGPFRGWVLSHTEMKDSAPMMRDYDQDGEHFEPYRRYYKEIDKNQFLDVVFQKR
jgi:hypothetical protein